MKTLTLNSFYPGYTDMSVSFRVSSYCDGGGLYIGIDYFDDEFQAMAPWCDMTVNIPETRLSSQKCAFVDVNNAGYLVDFIRENGLGVQTGRVAHSGYCVYPEYEFDVDKIAEHLTVENDETVLEYLTNLH